MTQIKKTLIVLCCLFALASCKENEDDLKTTNDTTTEDRIYDSGAWIVVNGTTTVDSGLGFACPFYDSATNSSMSYYGVAVGPGLEYDPYMKAIYTTDTSAFDEIISIGWHSTKSTPDTGVYYGDFFDGMIGSDYVFGDASNLKITVTKLTTDSLYADLSGSIERVEISIDSVGNITQTNTGKHDNISGSFKIERVDCQ